MLVFLASFPCKVPAMLRKQLLGGDPGKKTYPTIAQKHMNGAEPWPSSMCSACWNLLATDILSRSLHHSAWSDPGGLHDGTLAYGRDCGCFCEQAR